MVYLFSSDPFAYNFSAAHGHDRHATALLCAVALHREVATLPTVFAPDVTSQRDYSRLVSRSVAQMIREAPFDLYGLEGFTGARWIRSWEVGKDGAADMISLGHGLPPYSNPPGQADSLTDVSVRRKRASIDIDDTLLEMLTVSAFSGVADQFPGWRSQALARLAVNGWRDVSISVAGRPTSFALIELDAHWAALSVQPDLWLYALSGVMAWAELRLDVVQDRQQYIEGSALYASDLERRPI